MDKPTIWSWIREGMSRLIGASPVAATSASGENDALEDDGEPGEPRSQWRARRIWPFGIRSRPPAGTWAVFIKPRGGAGKAVMIGAESSAYGPDDLDVGEVGIYCKATGTLIKLDANGKITIDAASGQDVVVNGGTLEVARKTDPVRITAAPGGALATWMAQVETAINAIAPGSITPLSATFAAAPGMTINDGADHFKA